MRLQAAYEESEILHDIIHKDWQDSISCKNPDQAFRLYHPGLLKTEDLLADNDTGVGMRFSSEAHVEVSDTMCVDLSRAMCTPS